MRSQNKYKSYNQSIQIFEKFPLRILRFKNTKWKKVQKILLSKFSKIVKKKPRSSKPKKFKSNLLVKLDFKMWEKVKSFYQNGRKLTNLIFNTNDKSFANSILKKTLLNSKSSCEILSVYRQALLKPEFKLSTLLWKLNLFSSSFQASQAISEKKIYINNVPVKINFLLLKGDVIHLKAENYKKNIDVRKANICFSLSDVVFSFVEIDYYSNVIVVVKSLEDLSDQDLLFVKQEFYNLKKIKDYI
jgi:ribosomal protein S4